LGGTKEGCCRREKKKSLLKVSSLLSGEEKDLRKGGFNCLEGRRRRSKSLLFRDEEKGKMGFAWRGRDCRDSVGAGSGLFVLLGGEKGADKLEAVENRSFLSVKNGGIRGGGQFLILAEFVGRTMGTGSKKKDRGGEPFGIGGACRRLRIGGGVHGNAIFQLRGPVSRGFIAKGTPDVLGKKNARRTR